MTPYTEEDVNKRISDDPNKQYIDLSLTPYTEEDVNKRIFDDPTNKQRYIELIGKGIIPTGNDCCKDVCKRLNDDISGNAMTKVFVESLEFEPGKHLKLNRRIEDLKNFRLKLKKDDICSCVG